MDRAKGGKDADPQTPSAEFERSGTRRTGKTDQTAYRSSTGSDARTDRVSRRERAKQQPNRARDEAGSQHRAVMAAAMAGFTTHCPGGCGYRRTIGRLTAARSAGSDQRRSDLPDNAAGLRKARRERAAHQPMDGPRDRR